MSNDLNALAEQAYLDLDDETKKYLMDRGFSEEFIARKKPGVFIVDDEKRLSIPVMDAAGKCIAVKLRELPGHTHAGADKYLNYPTGAPVVLFGLESVDLGKPVIFCEGELDCWVMQQLDFNCITSTGGCSTFKEEWNEMFSKFPSVTVLFDCDDIGRKAALTVAAKIDNPNVFIADLTNTSDFKDITDYYVRLENGKEALEMITKLAQKFDPNKLEFSGIEFIEPPQEFNPSQYFTQDKAYITLKLPRVIKGELEEEFYVISSDRKIFELNSFLDKENLIMRKTPDFSLRWSRNSFETFLKSGVELKPLDVLDRLLKLIKKYITFDKESTYLTVALWVWGSYFYRLFKAYPYMNVTGLMGVGKTKLLEVCSELSFNGDFLLASTPAFVVRAISDNGSSLFLDEAERLKDTSNPDTQLLVCMLNAGYRAGPLIGKMEKAGKDKGWKPKRYDSYSPKMIAGIQNIAETLQSRSISITMLATSDKEVRNNEVDSNNPDFQEIRDQFYISTMLMFQDLRKAYDGLRDQELLGRNWQVWRPLLSLALCLDSARGDGTTVIYDSLRDFALEKVKLLASVSEDVQSAVQLLMALRDMLESDSKTEGFYPVENIKTYLEKERQSEFGWIKETNFKNYIGNTLRKSGVVEGGSRVVWFEKRAVRGYDLNLQLIKERLKALGIENP